MASKAQTADLQTPTPAAKVSLGSMLLVSVTAGVLAVAGCAATLLYFAHSGRLGPASTTQTSVSAKKAAAVESPLKDVVLEPLLVNLADPDGHSYLRLGLVLGEDAGKKADKEEKPVPGADAAVRDAVLGVLCKKSSAELLGSNGRDALKTELQAAVNKQTPGANVKAVYFTDFLVQR